MRDEGGFVFETEILPGAERKEECTMNAGNTAPGDNDTPAPPRTQPENAGNGVVAALQAKFNAEMQGPSSKTESPLLLLGAALMRYDVRSLSALLESAEADRNPPTYVVDILPLARHFVHQAER